MPTKLGFYCLILFTSFTSARPPNSRPCAGSTPSCSTQQRRQSTSPPESIITPSSPYEAHPEQPKTTATSTDISSAPKIHSKRGVLSSNTSSFSHVGNQGSQDESRSPLVITVASRHRPLASPSASAQCPWAGHCMGDPCLSDYDCFRDNICGPKKTCTKTCEWPGHCTGDPCKSDSDCYRTDTCGPQNTCVASSSKPSGFSKTHGSNSSQTARPDVSTSASGTVASTSAVSDNSQSFASPGIASPTSLSTANGTVTASSVSGSPNACGPVGSYFNQKSSDWVSHNIDNWLNSWWYDNTALISANSQGFVGAFGSWAIGNPDYNCKDDGSSSNCDFNACGNSVLNSKGNDMRPAYYVMESINRLNSYFIGLGEAFQVSAIGTALGKDKWATTFYKDKDDKSVVALREIMSALQMVIAIAAAFAGIEVAAVGAVAAAVSSMYGGAMGAILPLVGQHIDDTFRKSADLGGILATVVVEGMKSFISANNVLMKGQDYNGTGDIRSYLSGGTFVDFPGVDKNALINGMNAFLIGEAVNLLYRTQKIYILGGGACGDNQGIGSGPQNFSVCRNNQAWYLYYWQENDVVSLTKHQWGWTDMPPGSDVLGAGDYAGVTVEDIINSSLDAYNVAGYDYTNATATKRALSALEGQWANPFAQGPSWEGTFTIPVCDISASIGANMYGKEYILTDYDHDARPMWCGPICNNNMTHTKEFIKAANMVNFESPWIQCPLGDPGYQ